MKLKELLSEVRVLECTAALETEIRDISFDSRTTQPGDLFVAVCGYESDGHRFIGMATEKGAAAVLCQRKPETDVPYILVADSRLALAQVSCAYFGYPARELRMIGVTGTNGKTTTTTLIKHVLEQARGAKVLALTTEKHAADLAQRVPMVLSVPEVQQMLLPQLGVLPLQLLAYYIALERGCDIDKPRNLAKSVTVE